MKALIFDLDDTLYDQAKPFGKALEAYFPEVLPQLVPLYVAFRTYSDEVFEATVAGEMTLEESYIYRMQHCLADFGIKVSQQTALAIQRDYQVYQGQLELEPQYAAVFAFCQQQGIQMGIITNGPHLHQLKKIQGLDLFTWIPEHLTLISGQVGVSKPAPEIFQMLEDRLNLPAQDICYIGDSYATDICGAKAVGWQAIWLNHRKRQLPESGPRPDHTLTSLDELLPFLENS